MILNGDAIVELKKIPGESVHCCVTSPPYYGLRDYGFEGQIGLEKTPEEYVARLVEVFREVRRVLRDDGTLWLNLGDSYAGSWGNAGGHNRGHGTQRSIKNGSMMKNQATRNGSFVPPAKYGFKSLGIKQKDLIGAPWMVARALQVDGWWLRGDIIWYKKNSMLNSAKDRCSSSHEYVFHLTKSKQYFHNNDIAEYRRDVWEIPTKPYKYNHFAVMPIALAEVCIKAGCPEGGTVLDPFAGSGTTGAAANSLGRDYVLIEANPDYIPLIYERVGIPALL